MLGLLEALEDFDASKGAGFWTHAYRRVHDEIQQWIGRGVFWRKDGDRHNTEVRRAARERTNNALGVVSLDMLFENQDEVSGLGAFAGTVLRSASPLTPEDLVIERERTERAIAFVCSVDETTLSELDKDGRVIRSRHYKSLVSQAQAALAGGAT